MFKDIYELENFIAERDIKFIDLYYTDLFGNLRHLSTPSQNLDKIMEEGLAFDGSSVPGFLSVECGDLLLLPDPTAAFPDPFHESNVIILCRQVDALTREGNPADPRIVAERAEKHLKDTLGVTSKWLPELEFFLFNEVEYGNFDTTAYHRFSTLEFEGDETSFGYTSRKKDGYHAAPPQDSCFHIRTEMVRIIEELGIPVHYHHHEVGGASQQEIEMKLADLVRAADSVQVMKYIIRMVAMEYDLSACFLPKPIYGHPGNGMHFHMILLDDEEKSIFWEEGKYANLSDTAKYFIGGLLKHAPALVGITNPSTNSYKRLLPGFEAPTRIFYGLANRSAAIRIPKYTNTPETKRFEFRPPDATCNPYLAIAAMLMAGLDGVKNKIDPEAEGFGPFDFDVAKLPKEEKEKIKEVPTNLPDALKALKEDHEFLLEGGVFTKQFVESWIEQKWNEYCHVVARPSSSEIETYYNI